MSYHAQLSAHLSTLLNTHLDRLAKPDGDAEGSGGMVTDMKALRERDREHARAWMTEGYARYVGGAGGFELKVVPGASGASRLGGAGELGAVGGTGRKRRYTEEPGLLMRRGMGGMVGGSAVESDEEREGKRRRYDDRGRDINSVGSTRRTVSAGPTTPTTPDNPPAADPTTTNESRHPATHPPLQIPASSNNSVPSMGRAFTLQQPPAPRRPFRRPLQPRTITAAGEEENPSTGSIVLASAHLVQKGDHSMEDLRVRDGVAAAAAAAIGTSLSASSALSALAHTLVPLPQAAGAAALPCVASPSVGSLTSASLGCARAAMLTPLPTSGVDRQTVSPVARPIPRDLGMSAVVEETQSARIRRKEENEIWDCFMQLGETPGEGT